MKKQEIQLQLREWETQLAPISNENALFNLFNLQKRNILETKLSPNGIEVAANSIVGFEGNQHFSIEIKPKISGFSILKMIGYIHGFIPINQQDSAHLGEGEVDLFDLLIIQWLDLVEKLTPKLRQNYVSIRERKTYIKGKIIIDELAKQGIMRPRTPVEYQVLNIDQPLNQIIKWGLSYFKNQTVNPFLINKINLLLRDYTSVTDVLLTKNEIESSLLRLTRLEEDYKIPLEYLNWLISLSGVGSNNERGNSFWINMNSLFQNYLTKFFESYSDGMRFESEVSNRTIFKYDKNHNPLNRSSISIRPDLLVFFKNELTNIIDFKYKNYSENSINTADLYQLSNYGLAIGKGDINPIILYPVVRDFPDQIINVNLSGLNKEQNVIVRGVNLSYLQSLIDEQKHDQLSDYAKQLLK